MRLSPNYASYSFLPGLSFIRVKMPQKNTIALAFVGVGLLCCILLSYHLPPEKLTMALTGPTAVVGAGLAQWSNKDD
jgi:hypothetical protein